MVVTSPLVRPDTDALGPPIVARPRGRCRPAVPEEPAEPGSIEVRPLMRAQLKLAFTVVAVVVGFAGGLPLVFAQGPAVSRLRVAGLPVPWLLLALCIQPVWIVAAAWHVRRAERVEHEFAERVRRS